MDAVISGGAIGLLLLSGLGFLARWAWTHTHERINETREMIQEHDTEDRIRHEEVIRITTRLETQMGRFVSDIESEKRTRAEVNRELFRQLERIADRLPERRDERDRGER